MRIDEFLLARIAEDEARARAAMKLPEGVERVVRPYGPGTHILSPASDRPDVAQLEPLGDWGFTGGPPFTVADSGAWDESDPVGARYIVATTTEHAVRHVATWSPQRALAECAAKRAIVEALRVPDPHTPAESAAISCNDCLILYRLAAVYADHPDYRDEWRAA